LGIDDQGQVKRTFLLLESRVSLFFLVSLPGIVLIVTSLALLFVLIRCLPEGLGFSKRAGGSSWSCERG
jgi:hypothetical protein